MKTEYSDGRILIRPYKKADIEALYEAARESIDDIYPWLPWCHPDYAMIDSRYWVNSRKDAWKSGEEYSFVITDTIDGSFFGGVGINQINRIHNSGNLGYWVRTGSIRHGIATAATVLTAKFGFEQLKLNRLEIIAALGNRPSQRVAEKSGAVKEGLLRQKLFINGTYHDVLIYSLLHKDIV